MWWRAKARASRTSHIDQLLAIDSTFINFGATAGWQDPPSAISMTGTDATARRIGAGCLATPAARFHER
eukprot:COSAG06_NODE_906_length_11624_cov_6.452321_2_plen_69_part_00